VFRRSETMPESRIVPQAQAHPTPQLHPDPDHRQNDHFIIGDQGLRYVAVSSPS
jgi:hypothetical protein